MATTGVSDKADKANEVVDNAVVREYQGGREADELSALSLFKSHVNSAFTSKKITSQRQEYEDRLLTFQAATYMFKPACLSPIICARFGYVSIQLDPYFFVAWKLWFLCLSLDHGTRLEAKERIFVRF